MKIIVWAFAFLFCLQVRADYFYEVETGDQIGVILYSLGHSPLWGTDGSVNRFRQARKDSRLKNLGYGSVLEIKKEDIRYSQNIIFKGKQIFFKEKIRTRAQHQKFVSSLNIKHEPSNKLPALVELRSTRKQVRKKGAVNNKDEVLSVDSKKLTAFIGGGAFFANNSDVKDSVRTETQTGIQPMVQFKGIFSDHQWGDLSVDVLIKKIITSQFSFPINIDGRIQYLPFLFSETPVRLAVSHSILQHSYVGKLNSEDVAYDLKSRFVGIGIVVPRDRYWFEFYVEKAYQGEMESRQGSESRFASGGYRLDSELVYSVTPDWSLIPGINHYQLKGSNYKLNVSEFRLVFAREFSL